MKCRIIDACQNKLSTKQKQWLWFIALWLLGFLSLTLLSFIIKLIMGI